MSSKYNILVKTNKMLLISEKKPISKIVLKGKLCLSEKLESSKIVTSHITQIIDHSLEHRSPD